jgi:outer membrane protein
MRKLLIICFIAIFPCAHASADALGLYLGGGSWSHDPSGAFSSSQGGDTIDMNSDLNLSKKSEAYLWLAFEHPVPLLPNIRLEKTGLSHTSSTSSAFNFNGSPVATGATEVTLDSLDTILYYRLLDNWVNLDLGINLRRLDGRFAIGNESVEVTETVPMLYLAAAFDMPLTGLSLGADYKYVGYSGSSYNDSRIRLAYEMGIIGIEAGIRSTKITLDDVDGINSNIDFKGLMVGAFLHF